MSKGRKLALRIATDADCPRIKELLEISGSILQDIDMTGAAANWIVAEFRGNVVAAVQARVAKPVASLEMLVFDPKLSEAKRGRIVLQILGAGFDTLAGLGVQYCSTTIPFEFRSYRRALEKRGCVAAEQATVMVRRLR